MPTDPQALLDEVIDAFLAFYPAYAAGLGLHQYDGQPGDLSPEAVDARVRDLRTFDRRLAEVALDALSPQQRHEAALVHAAVRYELFEWTEWRQHTYSPIGASYPLDVTLYLKRDYAPLAERVSALTRHLEGVGPYLEGVRRHLTEPVPRPHLETAREIYRGHLAFFEQTVPAAVGDVREEVRGACLRAAASAAAAVRRFLAWLDEVAAPRAVDAFAIGETTYRRMLETGELLDLPLDRLVAVAEAELERLSEAVARTAAELDPHATPHEVLRRLARDHPPEAELLAATRRTLEELRAFLAARGIVALPDAHPHVEETPPFARWAFAMMDTAGPFEERATESYYYVTPPDPAWPPEQREEWLSEFAYHSLRATSIHEAYPGHFVHFMHIRRIPSRAPRIFTSYAFVEGWAHYCEEMMAEVGVDPDPRFRLGVLTGALVRVVRFLVSIGMHTRGMTLEEARRLFMERAFLEALPASKEAQRGTFDPGYLYYTLGKLALRKLREDVQREQGAVFSLRAFHDRLLALGAPPLALARRALLAHDDGRLL